jgi:hypothetical protein
MNSDVIRGGAALGDLRPGGRPRGEAPVNFAPHAHTRGADASLATPGNPRAGTSLRFMFGGALCRAPAGRLLGARLRLLKLRSIWRP